jgi:hypothetical protein
MLAFELHTITNAFSFAGSFVEPVLSKGSLKIPHQTVSGGKGGVLKS